MKAEIKKTTVVIKFHKVKGIAISGSLPITYVSLYDTVQIGCPKNRIN